MADPKPATMFRVDRNRCWPSTVETARKVPDWQEVTEDPEAREALEDAGLA